MSVLEHSAGGGLQTPVLFIIFKRLDTTRQVFEAIRQARPSRLYVAADGPRPDKPGEAAQTQATRAILDQVDWDCEVKTLFQDKNLGCGVGPATAISWLFEHEETGIILEDDCVPSQSFFTFCSEVLDKYRHDARIMQVSGLNPHQGWRHDPDYDYYFSQAGVTWGWATWRRAWNLYQYHVPAYAELCGKGYIEAFHLHRLKVKWALEALEQAHQKLPDISWWDFQWEFTKFSQSGLSVVPAVNLVRNIGFGTDATHTFDPIAFATAHTGELSFPLRHPPFVLRDTRSDERYFKRSARTDILKRIRNRFKRMMPRKTDG